MKIQSFCAIGVFVLTSAVLSASSQTINPAKIKFKGIGLGSTYDQVLNALGKPDLEEAEKEEGCIGGREKVVKYPGISFYFMDGDSEDEKTFEVKAFELTAPGYVVSGMRVGDTPAKVREILGRKYTVDADKDSGRITWLYNINDRDGPGTTRVVYKNGRVIMIASDFLVC